MLKDLHTNPVFAILTKNARPPLWLEAIISAGAIAVAVIFFQMMFALLMFALTQDTFLMAMGMLLPVELIGVLYLPIDLYQFVLPAIFAGIAALMTHRITSGEEYKILRTTPVSKRQISQGILGAVFYRLRYAYAIALGLSLSLIAKNLMSDIWIRPFNMSLEPDVILFSNILIHYVLQIGSAIIRLIGIGPLAALIGMAVALKMRQNNRMQAVMAVVLIYLVVETMVWMFFSLLPQGVWMIDSPLSSDSIIQTLLMMQIVIRLAYLPAAYLLYHHMQK